MGDVDQDREQDAPLPEPPPSQTTGSPIAGERPENLAATSAVDDASAVNDASAAEGDKATGTAAAEPPGVVPGDATPAGDPGSDEPMVGSAEVKAIVEALIFASPEPLSLKAIMKLLDSEPKEDVEAALAGLRAEYDGPGGLQLVEVAGGFQIVTRPDLHEWVRRLFHERSTQKLSVQALETLAVIAYRQPITAAEIAEIRGVNTAGVINTLLERHLVKIVGRKAVVGRPFMYATTREFLIRFGLNDITDLPRVQDMVDALGLESPLLVERMTAEEQLPLEEPDVVLDDAAAPADDGSGDPVH